MSQRSRAAIHDAVRLVEVARLEGVILDTSLRSALSEFLVHTLAPTGGWPQPSPDLYRTCLALELQEYVDPGGAVDGAVRQFIVRCDDPIVGLRTSPSTASTGCTTLFGGVAACLRCGLTPGYLDAIWLNLRLLQGSSGGLGPRHGAVPTLYSTWLGLEIERMLHDMEEVET